MVISRKNFDALLVEKLSGRFSTSDVTINNKVGMILVDGIAGHPATGQIAEIIESVIREGNWISPSSLPPRNHQKLDFQQNAQSTSLSKDVIKS